MYSPSECQEFLRNPGVNPKTHRKITIGGPKYKELVAACGNPEQVSPQQVSVVSPSLAMPVGGGLNVMGLGGLGQPLGLGGLGQPLGLGGLGQPLGQLNQPVGQFNQPLGQLNQPLGQLNQPLGQLNQPLGQLNQPLGQLNQPGQLVQVNQPPMTSLPGMLAAPRPVSPKKRVSFSEPLASQSIALPALTLNQPIQPVVQPGLLGSTQPIGKPTVMLPTQQGIEGQDEILVIIGRDVGDPYLFIIPRNDQTASLIDLLYNVTNEDEIDDETFVDLSRYRTEDTVLENVNVSTIFVISAGSEERELTEMMAQLNPKSEEEELEEAFEEEMY